LLGGVGIKATKTGGIWNVALDYSVLGPGPVSDPATAYIAIEDKTAGVYREVSLASLLTSGLASDLQAIAVLTSNGVLVRTADDTWALRTLTGAANEITVTNGDGVSGDSTVSLPAALTFSNWRLICRANNHDINLQRQHLDCWDWHVNARRGENGDNQQHAHVHRNG
jgi:hypothetical protein